jgi:hypothetical protein
VCFDSVKYDQNGETRWRNIVCSRADSSLKRKRLEADVDEDDSRNRASQRCKCPFVVRGIKSEDNGL